VRRTDLEAGFQILRIGAGLGGKVAFNFRWQREERGDELPLLVSSRVLVRNWEIYECSQRKRGMIYRKELRQGGHSDREDKKRNGV
jgi:hypothetical protein